MPRQGLQPRQFGQFSKPYVYVIDRQAVISDFGIAKKIGIIIAI
jgi:hypothetical protein